MSESSSIAAAAIGTGVAGTAGIGSLGYALFNAGDQSTAPTVAQLGVGVLGLGGTAYGATKLFGKGSGDKIQPPVAESPQPFIGSDKANIPAPEVKAPNDTPAKEPAKATDEKKSPKNDPAAAEIAAAKSNGAAATDRAAEATATSRIYRIATHPATIAAVTVAGLTAAGYRAGAVPTLTNLATHVTQNATYYAKAGLNTATTVGAALASQGKLPSATATAATFDTSKVAATSVVRHAASTTLNLGQCAVTHASGYAKALYSGAGTAVSTATSYAHAALPAKASLHGLWPAVR